MTENIQEKIIEALNDPTKYAALDPEMQERVKAAQKIIEFKIANHPC